MNIGLDFDDTYTADPDLFDDIIRVFQHAGHTVYIVTQRSGELRNIQYIRNAIRSDERDIDIEIFCTDCMPKPDYMERQGIIIDIWIDDNIYRATNGC